MNNRIVTLASVLVISSCLIFEAHAQHIEAKGSIEAVTVYRGQALVSRVIDVKALGGPVDLVVTDLPAHVVPDSLYASGGEDIRIRAVRFRSKAVEEEPREEVRIIDEKIKDIHRQLRGNKNLQDLRSKNDGYLTKLEQFTAATAQEEMARGILKADTVKSLTEFLFQERERLAKEVLRLKEQEASLGESLSLLKRQRQELTTKFPSSRTVREAVIFLDKQGRKSAKVRLNYLVRQAGWSPVYNLRCGNKRTMVDLECNALVQQMSGEDWDSVQLTLSTASSAMLADAPMLTPLWVTLVGQRQAAVAEGAGQVFAKQQAINIDLQRALNARKQVVQREEALDSEWAANFAANRLQMLDIAAQKDVLLAAQVKRPADEALSVNYALPGKTSIPSRTDQQMIQIAKLNLPSSFYYVATPVLSPYIYQHADVVNNSELALLPGTVNSYLDGHFMGVGNIPMVAKGQQFVMGFGVDSQLRASRELADKTDKVVGGNREIRFKYRLLAENFKDKPVKIRLMDRLPDPKDADIRITLGKMTDPLSKDEIYLRMLRKSGILRWEIEVPAKAAGADARMVEYDFKMEFDRNRHVGEPPRAELEKSRREFEALMQ